MINEGRKIMAMIAVILIVLCCCCVGLALTWLEGDPIPTPTIDSPTDGSIVKPAEEVGCEATSADSEQDEWCDEGGTGYCSDPKIGDQSNQKWTKSAGSWKDGVSTGKSVTWVAPKTVDGQATLTYTIDDTGTTYYNDTSKSANVTVKYCHTVDDYDEVFFCSDLEQHPTKNKEYDGCSPWFTPDNPSRWFPTPNPLCVNTGFTGPCTGHDECYQTCEKVKSICDGNFHTAMVAVCDALTGEEEESCEERCKDWADFYYDMVVVFGTGAYQNDQVQYCVCCDQEE